MRVMVDTVYPLLLLVGPHNIILIVADNLMADTMIQSGVLMNDALIVDTSFLQQITLANS